MKNHLYKQTKQEKVSSDAILKDKDYLKNKEF